jgi:hypothetical protein
MTPCLIAGLTLKCTRNLILQIREGARQDGPERTLTYIATRGALLSVARGARADAGKR